MRTSTLSASFNKSEECWLSYIVAYTNANRFFSTRSERNNIKLKFLISSALHMLFSSQNTFLGKQHRKSSAHVSLIIRWFLRLEEHIKNHFVILFQKNV